MEEKTRVANLSTHCFVFNKKYQRKRLEKLYLRSFVQDFYLKKGVKCQNIFLFPKLNKLVVNKSSKEFVRERVEILPSSLSLLFLTGQRSQPRLALKSIAGFKLREKQYIGCKVTLRRNKSLELLERVTQLVLPLSRDFSGILATSFDSYGNISLGCKESLLFPELSDNFEFFERLGGFDLCLSISSTSRKTSKPKKTFKTNLKRLVRAETRVVDLSRETANQTFVIPNQPPKDVPSNALHKRNAFYETKNDRGAAGTTLAESVLFCTAMQLPSL